MSPREPWLGVASAAGLVLMLVGEGVADVVGFLVAIVPLAYGVGAALARRTHDRSSRQR